MGKKKTHHFATSEVQLLWLALTENPMETAAPSAPLRSVEKHFQDEPAELQTVPLRFVEKHFQERSAELQIPRLRSG
jgi:hypothetical protein